VWWRSLKYALAEVIRRTVGIEWREEIDTIVAPVAVPGALGHRHELDGGNAKCFQLLKLTNQRGECAFRSHGADVKFVDHQALAIEPTPFAVAPVEGVGIDNLGRAMNAIGLGAGVWIRSRVAAIEAVGVACASPDAWHQECERAVAIGCHRQVAVSEGEFDPVGVWGPDGEANAVALDFCPECGSPWCGW
jgi:hypothetical protein